MLARRRARASFFLTGAFLRDAGHAPLVKRMVQDGHYVGPHSDAHLLYSPWSGPKVTLVSRETFTTDLERNLEALEKSGIGREREDPHGLNGFMLLLHVGAGPRRADKFHARFDELVGLLAGRGYAFVRVDTLLADHRP